ncbi:tail protein P2 I [Tepidimonas ignava]|uniref:Phage tail protein n=1 Tax=Tepidimonas ignava TaxID=114249 RepID=A0A4R3L3L5_9BURK|nr:phage tail protein [Tepidimonas ignava]TCS94119.1 tail protein P2 I [Tepidimonas ignava]TSE18945.1 Phage tail protein [Tepidimonas ignava]
MTERADLLPLAATGTERAISRAIGPWTPGANIIHTLADPARIPAALLPHLGAGEDLPPVRPADEASRRALIQASPRLHALIGTPKGLRELARLAGAHIARLEMPPAKTFLGFWDEASRRQWLDAHPQMRIRSARQRAPSEGFALGSAYIRDPSEPPVRTAAMARAAIRAEIVWPDGRVEPLTTHGWSTIDDDGTGTIDLSRRAVAVGLVLSDPLAGVISRADASARYWRIARVSYRERRHLLLMRQMSPSLKPLTPDAEPVAERAARVHASCLGAPITHTARSDAQSRIYTRIRLHDPQVAARPKHGPTYIGFARLTSPPFVAIAHVRMPARRLPMAIASTAMRAPLSSGDANRRIAPVLDAMDWSRATHDKILVRSRLHATARASRIYMAGRVLAGQTIPRS